MVWVYDTVLVKYVKTHAQSLGKRYTYTMFHNSRLFNRRTSMEIQRLELIEHVPPSATLSIETPCSWAMNPNTGNMTNPAKRLVPLLTSVYSTLSLNGQTNPTYGRWLATETRYGARGVHIVHVHLQRTSRNYDSIRWRSQWRASCTSWWNRKTRSVCLHQPKPKLHEQRHGPSSKTPVLIKLLQLYTHWVQLTSLNKRNMGPRYIGWFKEVVGTYNICLINMSE